MNSYLLECNYIAMNLIQYINLSYYNSNRLNLCPIWMSMNMSNSKSMPCLTTGGEIRKENV